MKKFLLVSAVLFVFSLFVFGAEEKQVDRILVKVNNDIILESELDEAVSFLSQQLAAQGKPADKKDIEKKILGNLIEQKLITTVASDENVVISEEAVADKVNEYLDKLRQGFKTEELFEEALKKEGINYSDFRLRIEDQVRNSLVYSKIKQKKQQEFIVRSAVNDIELMKYYEANKGEFKVQDEVSLAQIFFAKSTKDAASSARTIYQTLSANGNFDAALKAAKNLSGDGGSLGWVDTAQMSKEIRDAIKNPRKGKVIGPVETEDGYHIIKIADYRKGKLNDFEEIKEKVRVKVIESKVEKLWEEWIAKVKKQAYIKYM